jgi:hypothetical protein
MDAVESNVVPANDLPDTAQAPVSNAVPADDLPEGAEQPQASAAVPDHDIPDEHSGPLDTFKAGVEAAERKLTLGGSDYLRKHLDPLVTGEDPEEIRKAMKAREEQNPIAVGVGNTVGTIGALAGMEGLSGAAGLTSAIGTLPTWGKVAAHTIKGAIENGVLQGGDELSDAMLRDKDPEHPVAAALANVGNAMLIGGGISAGLGTAGVGLRAIGDSALGRKAGQMLADLGNRWNFRMTNPDLTHAITDELKDFHGSTMNTADEVYGAGNLKDQAIKKLVPPMNPQIANQSQEIATHLQDKLGEMVKDTDSYPPRLIKQFQGDINKWMETATNPQASSYDTFNATQALKQKMQFYAKFEKQINPLAPEGPFVNAAKDTSHFLRESLEDPKVWDKAGDLQKGINNAFSELISKKGPLQTFKSKFISNNGLEDVIDPGKVKTYVNQLGSPRAEIKKDVVQNYVNAMEKYRNKIGDLHGSLGIESPLEHSSLNALKQTYGKISPGSKIADYLFDHGPSKVAQGVGTGAGALIGGFAGGGGGATAGILAGKELAPYLEESVGRPVTNVGVAALLKAFANESPDAAGTALQYAANVKRGDSMIGSALDKVFRAGSHQAFDSTVSKKDTDKLKKFVEDGGVNTQMQNSLNKLNQQTPAQPQNPPGFAHGGEVKPSAPPTQMSFPAEDKSSLSSVYPAQNMMLESAKGRVYNYLNQIRPQKDIMKLPYDHEPDTTRQEKTYDKVAHMALSPLSIMNHVKDGSITPEDMKHFTNLYPELHSHLSKEITKKITHQQMDESRPNYKTRQGLSLFLGAPMDSSFKPSSIQAIQGVFAKQSAQKQAAAQAQTKTKRNTSKLSEMAGQYKTQDQAAQSRADK